MQLVSGLGEPCRHGGELVEHRGETVRNHDASTLLAPCRSVGVRERMVVIVAATVSGGVGRGGKLGDGNVR